MLSSLPKLLSSSVTPKPFLKWAGGKTQLIEQISNFLPTQLNDGSIKKYVEPFIGGGAIFFWLANKYQIAELFISDINIELIIAYKTIQRDVDNLIELLSDIEVKYLSFNESQRYEYFYKIRRKFNYQREKINLHQYNNVDWRERTAEIIFLNKTCYNGLFRVNSKGDFNVPMGSYKKPTICESEKLKLVANLLQRTEILQGDFTVCDAFVDSNTFVYFDPPYRPISKTSNFTSYSHQSFGDLEQIRLRDLFKKLDKQGALLLLSNSDPKNQDINDNFFENAYADYRIERVKASRFINSNASKRSAINELLIMNY
jgi:DNA adenine methylase